MKQLWDGIVKKSAVALLSSATSVAERAKGIIKGPQPRRNLQVRDGCAEGVLPLLYKYGPVETIKEPIVVEVNISLCRDPYGFGFGADGWHPLIETLRQYDTTGNRSYNGSFLERFYDAFRPVSASDALGIEGVPALDRAEPMGWVTPWSTHSIADAARRKKAVLWEESKEHGSEKVFSELDGFSHFGPVSEELGEFEMKRLVDTYESIKRHGYDRVLINKDIAVKVIRDDFQERYVVVTGRHRIAALSALAYKQVPVRILFSPLPVIHTRDILHWCHVKDELYSIDSARAYVERLFRDDGRDRAAALGLPIRS